MTLEHIVDPTGLLLTLVALAAAVIWASRRGRVSLRDRSRRLGVAALGLGVVVLSALLGWLLVASATAEDEGEVAAGGFTTALTIPVPAFRGLEPTVGLSYDSQAGNGVVGVGWRLETGSSVQRAGRHGGTPRFDATDRFLLDGAELVPCTTPCASGGTHETRQRDFTRIRRVGANWHRWRPDGTKLEYTPLALGGGSATYRWALSKVTDTHSNSVTYTHGCPDDCYLSEISYGDTPAAVGAKVRFHYETRSDPIPYGTGAGIAVTSKRLRTVEVRMRGQLVRAQRFTYGISSTTGASVLRSAQLFPRDATVDSTGEVTAGATAPAPATTFTTVSTGADGGSWKTGTESPGGLQSLPPLPATTAAPPDVFHGIALPQLNAGEFYTNPLGEDVPRAFDRLTADVDGDRRSDLVNWAVTECGSLVVEVTRALDPPGVVGSTSSGPCENQKKTQLPVSVLSGAFGGRGEAEDLLFRRGKFVLRAVALGDGAFTFDAGWRSVPADFEDPCVAADQDGDDRDELLCARRRPSTGAFLDVVRLADDGSLGTVSHLIPGAEDDPTATATDRRYLLLTAGDIDGNGTAEPILALKQYNCACSTWRLFTGRTAGTAMSWHTSGTTWPFGGNASLLSGDTDGNGTADVALVKHGLTDANTPRSAVVYSATSPRGADTAKVGPLFVDHGKIVLPFDVPALSDVDGDGRTDLVSRLPGHAPGLATGGFGGWTPGAGTECAAPQQDPAPGDVNGDGFGDVLCLGETVGERLAPTTSSVLHRWMPADVTGTGRQSLVSVRFTNPGYEVFTLHRSATGTWARTMQAISPSADAPDLTEPDAGGWMPVDVGSPSDGKPDGKADLIRIDRYGAQLRVYSLLSTGTGWEPRVDRPWTQNGTVVPYPAHDLHSWRPAQVNKDGRTDFVRLAALETGVGVETLLAAGDGTYRSDAGHYLHAGSNALTVEDASTFRSLDNDGSGLTSFAYVQPGDAGRLWTLAANGDGTWTERSAPMAGGISRAEARAFTPTDLNGDGQADLAALSESQGCLSVRGVLSTGAAWTFPAVTPTTWCAPANSFAGLDRNRMQFADVNADGRSDISYLSATSGATGTAPTTTTARALLNLPAGWTMREAGLPLPAKDTWAYTALDLDVDGHPDLLHIAADKLTTVTFRSAADRLTGTDNGVGATTGMSYAPLVGSRSYLPAGSLPMVVSAVTVKETKTGTSSTTTRSYDGALWSDRDGRLLGFGSVTTTTKDSVNETRFQLSDACGARIVSAAAKNAAGAVFRSTDTAYGPPGSSAPYTCLLESTTDSQCELTTTCAVKTTSLSHDSAGNVVTTTESGTLAGTRTTTTRYLTNTVDHILDRPWRRQTTGTSGSATKVLSITEFGYDGLPVKQGPGSVGDLTEHREWDDQSDTFATTKYGYDARGNQTAVTGPTGKVTTTTYDPASGLFPVAVNTKGVGTTTQSWDEVLGTLTSATDLNGQVTTTGYDAFGRQTEVKEPGGGSTTTAYLDNGRTVRTAVADGSPGDGVLWQEQNLDGLGRTYRTVEEGDAAGPIVTDIEFSDATSRPAKTSDPHSAKNTPVWTTQAYDATSRPTKTTLPDGATTNISYAVGSVTTTNPTGRIRTDTHDEFGRVVEVKEGPGEKVVTTYTYDAVDRPLTARNDAGHSTMFIWDTLGRNISSVDPDRGKRSRTYRPDGLVATETDEKQQTTNWDYDGAGRLTRQELTGAGGTTVRTWTWDTEPGTGALHGHSRGRIVRAEATSPEGGSAENLWYDEAGRITRASSCIDGDCAQLGTGYDVAGRVATLTYPAPDGTLSPKLSETVRHTYDTAGRLTSVVGSVGRQAGTAYLASANYDAVGSPKRWERGNGVTETFAYDPQRHWLDSLTVSSPASQPPLLSQTFEHHPDGNVSQLKETSSLKSGTTSVAESYTYDPHDRLTRIDSTDPARDEAFAYDPLGRMTWSTATGDRRYTDADHVHAVTETDAGHAREYDANGNTTKLSDPQGRSLTMEWTPEDRPKLTTDQNSAVTTTAYGHDGARVLTRTGAGTTRYFNRHAERDETGALVTYYWAGDQLLASRSGSAVTWSSSDRMGSTRVTTDSAGQVINSYDYTGYGRVLPSNGTDAHLFAGSRQDQETGLAYLEARFYDAELAQFLSADTILPDPYRPQSLNRYSYTENNPTNYNDPSGHQRIPMEQRKERDYRSWHPGRGTVAGECGALTHGCLTPEPQNLTQEVYGPDPAELDALASLLLEEQLSLSDPEGSPFCLTCEEVAEDAGATEPAQEFGLGDHVDAFAHGGMGVVLEIGGRVSVLLGTEDKEGFQRTMEAWRSAGQDLPQSSVSFGQDFMQELLTRRLGGKPPAAGPGHVILHATIPAYERDQYMRVPDGQRRAFLNENLVCVYCSNARATRLDHILALKEHWMRGGWKMSRPARSAAINDPKNWAASCVRCNAVKGAKRLGGKTGFEPDVWKDVLKIRRRK